MTGEQHAKADEIAKEIREINGHISMARIYVDAIENRPPLNYLINVPTKYLPANFFTDYVNKLELRITELENEFAKL